MLRVRKAASTWEASSLMGLRVSAGKNLLRTLVWTRGGPSSGRREEFMGAAGGGAQRQQTKGRR